MADLVSNAIGRLLNPQTMGGDDGVYSRPGVGLNSDRGFGSRFGGVYSTAAANNPALGPYLDRMRQREGAQQQGQLADQGYAFQREMQGNQLGLERERLAQQGALQRMQIDASLAPTRFAERRFDTLLPMARGMMTQAGRGQITPLGPAPNISDAPVYSEQQIQAQVNAQRAQNDAQAAGRQRQMQESMAGRGYGARSPLGMALANNIAGQNLMANTSAENDLRYKAAAGNSQQVLEAQKARSLAYLGSEGENTKRQKIASDERNALMASLLGML